MGATVKLTASQAMIRWLVNQHIEEGDDVVPYFAGCWAIFGHGNVAALGEALHAHKKEFPTYRAHNEQAMVHAAVAYAKQKRRQRAMMCTTSIGPGATNMVTAAAGAHVNRLPVLLVPGDVYASRRPDPVLQQAESFVDATASFNDCFKPASRYFDRITRPEQILDTLPKAMRVLRDPALCGPATLAFCQDVQAEAFEYPLDFFEKRVWRDPRPSPDEFETQALAEVLKSARAPLIIAGGGVLYSQAENELADFSRAFGIPVVETQAGKGSLAWTETTNLGAVGVTGTGPANAYAEQADIIIGIGTRLSDFTSGSRTLFPRAKLIQVNVQPLDAIKHSATPIISDAKTFIGELTKRLGDWKPEIKPIDAWLEKRNAWFAAVAKSTEKLNPGALPSDAQVVETVQTTLRDEAVVVCAAGGLPGELHKLWRCAIPGGYHLEYGFSCMGYEIAGGVGVKLAEPDRDVVVMVGDGSYLMLNSEIATAVMLGMDLTVIVLDNGGYGCINRLQQATGSPGFNNLLSDSIHQQLPDVDFAAHAKSLGAQSQFVRTLDELQQAVSRATEQGGVNVIVIETDPLKTTEEGGWWWDVAVPEVSERTAVQEARKDYEQGVRMKRDLS